MTDDDSPIEEEIELEETSEEIVEKELTLKKNLLYLRKNWRKLRPK